jgi:hypothetical protein
VPFERHASTLTQQQRAVDFLNKRQDQECALLLAMGFSDRFIQSRCTTKDGTPLSTGQIQYRGKKAGVSRMSFRNGEGVFAKTVMAQAKEVARPKLISHLQRTGVLYSHAA